MSMRQLKITKSITTRESQSVEKYLQEIDRIPLLSPEEEVYLSRLIKKGDKAAMDRLTKANLRFVVSVAKQYQGQGFPLSDLINEGNIGLITAARRFDETRGFKFISFAVWWIRQNILQALADQSRMIRLPLNKVMLSRHVHKAHTQMEQKLERDPSSEELAEALNMELDEVEQSLGHSNRHVSLDNPLSEGEENTLLNTLVNPDGESAEGDLHHGDSLKKEIARTFRILTDKQKQTLCYFFGIGTEQPMSLEAIGSKLDLTTERVRQIRDKALSKLRTTQNINLLRGFLG